jgi:hypothetical protein
MKRYRDDAVIKIQIHDDDYFNDDDDDDNDDDVSSTRNLLLYRTIKQKKNRTSLSFRHSNNTTLQSFKTSIHLAAVIPIVFVI